MIPLPIVYAGLAGTLLALIVATAQNKWQAKVFFLLALRLAIGWHFAFEGLHKIHSHAVGPTETSKPFTSEPYFALAEGPLGPIMRKQFLSDPDALIAERIAPKADQLAGFAKLSRSEQASLCPAPIAEALKKAAADGLEQLTKDVAAAKKVLLAEEENWKVVEKDPDAKKVEAGKKKYDDAKTKLTAATDRLSVLDNDAEVLRLTYARWVYGLDRRDGKVKYISTDVPQTVSERLAHIALLKKQVEDLEVRDREKLGNGYGMEMKRAAAARTDLSQAKADLIADAQSFLADLIKYAGGVVPEPAAKPITSLDKQTMWMITVVGFLLLFGFLTPVACVVGAGFLLMTYLAHPPFPWLPLPPGTEGNPLFINKNIIEMLALLVVAVHPTGRWLGLDALWTYFCFDRCCTKPDITAK
jgi:uncharacterized membrane protein YphA (DoxX/SURF4 family)